jgi:hypothetical protein
MPSQTRRISLPYSSLLKRRTDVTSLVRPLVGATTWIDARPSATTSILTLSVQDSASEYRVKTRFEGFSLSYLEEWHFTGERRKNDDIWRLEKAYFTLFRANPTLQSYDEYICLHCWEGFAPSTEGSGSAGATGLAKQQVQEKYQRSIHMHMKFLSGQSEKEYGYIAKAHLAITLGRDTYEFGSIDELSRAMTQALQLLNDEILEAYIELI